MMEPTDVVDCGHAKPVVIRINVGTGSVGYQGQQLAVTTGQHSDEYNYDYRMHRQTDIQHTPPNIVVSFACNNDKDHYITTTESTVQLKWFDTTPNCKEKDGRMFILMSSQSGYFNLESTTHQGHYLCHHSGKLMVKKKHDGACEEAYDFDFPVDPKHVPERQTSKMLRQDTVDESPHCLRRCFSWLFSCCGRRNTSIT